MVAQAVTSADVMARVREAYLDSSLSYTEIGVRMGYRNRAVAKQIAFAFINKTRNPRAAKLRMFAHAVGVPVSHLLAFPRQNPR